MNPSFIKTSTHLTIVFGDGEMKTIYNSHTNYDAIITSLNIGDWESVKYLAEIKTPATRMVDKLDDDRVTIKDGVVNLDGHPIDNALTQRMLDIIEEGITIEPLKKFLVNLQENTSYRAVEQLYSFLEYGNLPITEDGQFLAYKRVTIDWMDEHSGTNDNHIGCVVTMLRNLVNEDPNQTCSAGLHFCSREYLPAYGSKQGGRVIIIKIHPRDVVAIPRDYNDTKGRCCRYEVINELVLEDTTHSAMPVATLEGTVRDTGNPETTEIKPGTRMIRQRSMEDDSIIAIFDTPSAAEKATGIDASGISKVARGLRKTAGGYGWEYIQTEETPTPKPVSEFTQQLKEIQEEEDDDYDDEFDDFWDAEWEDTI